jgi:hypothetical protein
VQQVIAERRRDLRSVHSAKPQMPARLADRHRDGECDAYTSQAPASDYRDLARERQDHDPPIAGGGQSATVGLSRRSAPAGCAADVRHKAIDFSLWTACSPARSWSRDSPPYRGGTLARGSNVRRAQFCWG